MNIQITPNEPSSSFAKKVWLVVSMCVVLFVGYAFYQSRQQSEEWIAAGGTATGTVLTSVKTDSFRSTSGGSRMNYTSHVVTFSFTAKDGKQYIVTDKDVDRSFDKGSSVSVIYNPHNPDEAHIKGLLD